MRFKRGVKMNVLPPILPALWAAERVWTKHGRDEGVTVTSANDGVHSYNSRHYVGLALDFRSRRYGWDEDKCEAVTRDLQRILGNDYFCLNEYSKYHIHTEYRPHQATDFKVAA